MSRDPETVAKITENTYKNVMDQFNPGLRNLVNLGRNYEKAVSAMVQAGRAYYDGVAKVGEMTTVSPVSKELGLVLQEISSVHKKLNESLEENFKKFHREIIAELERKTEQDIKYMNATLKRYQTEHKNKLDSLEKSQAELKKLRRKSQGARNATKYEVKETEYLETITSRQSEIQKFISEGCREALLEEKRRFCFLVDKHCNFSSYLNYYHVQAADILASKLPKWQETCSDVTQVPDNVANLMQDMKPQGPPTIPGTPEPSPLMDKKALMNANYDTITRKMPPAPQTRAHISPLVDMFSSPSAGPKTSYENPRAPQEMADDANLPRSMSVATGLNLMKKPKVKTIFPHTGSSKTLLSFAQGDLITLLIPEEKDGWLYGEHDATKLRGWFPSSYTRPLEENGKESPKVSSASPSPAPVRSLSSANLIDKGAVVLPEPDYFENSSSAFSTPRVTTAFTVPLAKEPATVTTNDSPKPTANGVMKHPFLSGENPFATVKLRPTVTNDRSAPIIR
ncbi:brain-specific angiogenesis inhibitor 1-associated protein 2-like protein 1 isoform X2 [Spea bombifrons]|uniref:brain-specific angiogenesis inhibitor 1-associated protein 2-like protein 1 isoform X2 n=1 Tax=Spea bombifrons TaxID=233779 RepID=UPI0023491E82|nr:brain-specific angiogenesis inhibitor 1-associated protein 2-like protein 1 isoform X2 [Spea bombifrons]